MVWEHSPSWPQWLQDWEASVWVIQEAEGKVLLPFSWLSPLSPLILPGTPAYRMLSPTSRVVPFSVHPLWKHPHRHLQVCLPGAPNPARLITKKTNHLRYPRSIRAKCSYSFSLCSFLPPPASCPHGREHKGRVRVGPFFLCLLALRPNISLLGIPTQRHPAP